MAIKTNLERLKEIVEYADAFGVMITSEKYGIRPDTIYRYQKELAFRLKGGKSSPKETPKVEVVKRDRIYEKLKEHYSEEELARLARGRGVTQSAQINYPKINFDGNHVRFGFVTDTHIGSLYFIEKYWFQFLDVCTDTGCEFIAHTGDVCEGLSNRPGHAMECTHIGHRLQLLYAVDLLSKWEKPIYLIDGNHDRWFEKSAGASIVEDIADSIPNATFLAHEIGDLLVNGCKIRLVHGEDGSSYATSYRPQKWVESFCGGDKPNVLLMGHVHKQCYIFERNVHIFSGGCLSLQSAWMKSKRLAAHSGFWIIDLWIGKKGGVNRCGCEWYPIYV